MNNLSAHDSENGFNRFDLFLRHGEIVVGERGEIRQLAGSNRAFLSVLTRKPTAALRIEPKRFSATQAVPLGIHRSAADGLAGHQPIEPNPRIISCNSRRVRPRPDRTPKL